MQSEQAVNRAIEAYGDTVRRICLVHLKNQADTEDIFQTVFLKYLQYPQPFESAEHEKAWLIRVAINACRDHLKSFFRRHMVSMDELGDLPAPQKEDYSQVLQAVCSLAPKYRDVVYLFFYEQYTAVEIGRILGKNVNTVYTWLARAKEMLREKLGGEGFATTDLPGV